MFSCHYFTSLLAFLSSFLAVFVTLLARSPCLKILLSCVNYPILITVTIFTSVIRDFAICCFFTVCWLMAKTLFAISYQKPNGKELADGKDTICHEPGLCRPPGDGKEHLGRRQRARAAHPGHRARPVTPFCRRRSPGLRDSSSCTG